MKQPVEVTVLALLLVAAGAIFWRQANLPPEAAQVAKPLGVEQACTAKCQSVATELKCTRGDQCAELCGKLAAATTCMPQVERFIQCFVKQPSLTWHCEDGVPMLGHVCEGEQNNIADCMMHNGRRL